MKRTITVLLCIAGILALFIGGILLKANRAIREIKAAYATLEEIPLSAVADGTYHGKCGSVPVYVNLELTVKDHMITDISIHKQRCGRGYDAKEIVPRIIESQKILTDAVSGATTSSYCIMVAAHRALSAGR